MVDITEIILQKIREYDNIALFFHERPDFDALGSCFGLKEFINDNFPQKKVKIIGLDTLPALYGSSLFVFDRVANASSDFFLANALGIVSDTANAARVYSRKNSLCKETLRVDHHPHTEVYCDFEWVDPLVPAACEMWAFLFFNSKLKVSPLCAKYLYAGLLTDTGRFLYPSVTPQTYQIAAQLVALGFNRIEVHDAIYQQSLDEIKFATFLMKQMVIKGKVAYFIIPKGSHKKYNVYPQFSMVNLLANIEGIEVWATLYYDEQTLDWKGSIRSKNLQINHIAAQFGGGGHKLAAGFSLSNEKDFNQVIDQLVNLVSN